MITSSMRVRGRACNTVNDDSLSIHGDTQAHHVLCNIVLDTMNTPCHYNEASKPVFLMILRSLWSRSWISYTSDGILKKHTSATDSLSVSTEKEGRWSYWCYIGLKCTSLSHGPFKPKLSVITAELQSSMQGRKTLNNRLCPQVFSHMVASNWVKMAHKIVVSVEIVQIYVQWCLQY